MSQRQLASVLFAVVGLFLAIFRIPDLLLQTALLTQWQPESALADSAAPQRFTLILATAASALSVALGLALVGLRNRLADRLFPASPAFHAGAQIQAVALSVLGGYFVIQGIYNAMGFGAMRWAGVIQLLAGLALFFGSGALASRWARLNGEHPSNLSVNAPSN